MAKQQTVGTQTVNSTKGTLLARKREKPSMMGAVQQMAVPHHSAPVAGASSTSFAAACSCSGTRVQSGGRTGRGGYAVGPFRLTSQGCVFLGLVFMWCAVAFFCGRDEHSTPIHPPPPGDAGDEALGLLLLLVHDMGTAYANIPVIDAIVSRSLSLSSLPLQELGAMS